MRLYACSVQSCEGMFEGCRFANYQLSNHCFRLLRCSSEKKSCSPRSSEVESGKFVPLCTIGVCDKGALQIFFLVSQIARKYNEKKAKDKKLT